jgi:hypothetical protein
VLNASLVPGEVTMVMGGRRQFILGDKGGFTARDMHFVVSGRKGIYMTLFSKLRRRGRAMRGGGRVWGPDGGGREHKGDGAKLQAVCLIEDSPYYTTLYVRWTAHRFTVCVEQGNGGAVLGVLGGRIDLQRCSFRNGTGGIREVAHVRHTSP